MKKQFVLISGLASVATLAVAGLAVARGSTVLADPVAPGDYVAVINSENRIKNDGTGHNAMNGFRLHGGEEYGQFSLSNLEKINMNEEGYGFSITMASSFYFNIKTSDLGEGSYWAVNLDGKKRQLRGFPGAYKIEIVYDIAADGKTLQATKDHRDNENNWDFSTSKEGDVITDTYTLKVSENSDDRFQFIRDQGGADEYTFKVHSLSIWYTC